MQVFDLCCRFDCGVSLSFACSLYGLSRTLGFHVGFTGSQFDIHGILLFTKHFEELQDTEVGLLSHWFRARAAVESFEGYGHSK